ncbi:MAG: response regulator [Bacteroidia bacterium]
MKNILVIEDNIELRENTAELLELAGYNVLTAQNGKVGFEAAMSFHPDVILCELIMPKWDGAYFLKMISEEKEMKEIPLLFFSTGFIPSYLDEETGGIKFINKPFSGEELLNAVAAKIPANKKYN